MKMEYGIIPELSSEFGSGKDNTITMLLAWHNGDYGPGNESDIWDDILDICIVEEWFIPSREEFAACWGELSERNVDWFNTLDTWENNSFKIWTSSSGPNYDGLGIGPFTFIPHVGMIENTAHVKDARIGEARGNILDGRRGLYGPGILAD